MELALMAIVAWILHGCSCPYNLLCQVSFEYIVSTVLTGIICTLLIVCVSVVPLQVVC